MNEKTPLFAPVSVSAFPPKANGEDVKVVTSESKNTKPLTEIASVPGPAPVNVASFSKSHSTMPHRASVSELTKQPDLPATPNRDVAWSVSDTLAPTLPDQIERGLEPITIARFNADAIAEKGFLDGGFLESDHQLLVSALASDDDDVEAQELNANQVDPSSAPKEPATKKNDSLATASPESKRDSKPVQEDSLATLPPTPSMLIADEQQLLNLSLVDAAATALSQSPNIRVVAKTPQILSNDIVVEDAFFDPLLGLRVQGAKQDQQLADTLESFGGTFTENQLDTLTPLGGLNNLSIGQQLRSGGEYELGVGTVYNYFDRVGAFRLVNPAWQSAINLRVEQPLLAGRGREIAETGIEIARANNRQAVELFRAEVNTILRDVEIAYWDVALLEKQAEIYRSLLLLTGDLVKAEKERLDLGDGVLPDVIEAREQYVAALASAASIEGERREASQRLVNLLGYPSNQPILIRTETEVAPELQLPPLEQGIARMMLRPEIDAQRSAIRRSEIELRRQINSLQPDLRMFLDYSVTGLAERLSDSMETVADNDFTYAALGFVLQQPMGRRAAFALVRRAQLTLCQDQQQLELLQHQYSHNLQGIYKQLEAQREVVMLARQRVDLAKEQYALRLEQRNDGDGTLDSVLRTQQRLLTAETSATEALYDYQQLLVLWSYEQGSISDEKIIVSQ